ncbi:hypothetical protein [Vitiosangium sp. GDMCC 1.1324]|uniref:hypothetical protein n=1 Tax=Vitiosangium sp. (strain GDMCC 1.1324) TaxID=2138576 RepID=UPI000D36E186|nr:hypothetical protein [Vitiosangium sp. GDMCC 1.1324]PTL80520.1 hypothetical protein DAT35_28205 [Vitiosangium sp. GDMCC 1.1324]
MTKKLVGLFASVALLSSGLALANNQEKGKQHTQSSQQMGSEAYGGAGQMGAQAGQMAGEKQIVGTVVKSSSDELKLRTDNGIIAVKVDKNTKFEDPSIKKAKDLKEGQQVRTSFTVEKDNNLAKSISLNTSMGGSGMGTDQGINQDTGGSGLNQDINKGQQGQDVGGDVGGSGTMGGSGQQGSGQQGDINK